MPYEDDLDNLLDDVLQSLAAREPRHGLPERVIARLDTANTPARRPWWPLVAIALASACAAALLILANHPRAVVIPGPTIASSRTPAPDTQKPVAAAVRLRAPQPVHHRFQRRYQPRLSEQERLLLQVVQLPEEQREFLLSPPRFESKLVIPELVIAPIQLSSLENKGESAQ